MFDIPLKFLVPFSVAADIYWYMPESDDIALLKGYAESGSESAFAELVARYINLVYSAALRSVGDAQAAEEITQVVFIILARKAKSLGDKAVLSGWLYQTARLTAANYLRGEIRRQNREQEAYMQAILNEPESEAWRQIAPLLDDAMGRLGETDRNAIVLRFFENKNLSEVGAALGASEDAAKMRVNRALEKLRKCFTKRGVALSGTIIAGAVSTNSVHAASAALAKTISAMAVTKGAAASASTLTLVKGALKIMAWTKAKTAIVTGAAVILAAGVTTSLIAQAPHDKSAASKTELTEAGDGAYGLYIHFGIATFANPGEKGVIPASRFAPASLDAQRWVHAAKQAGMTYAVLTAKHESGFCLWDSPDYSYDVGNSPFKGDIIGDFIAACNAEGIAPGVHYSIPDEFNEGTVRYNGAVVSPAYFDIIKKHVIELHTLYPDLRVQIFDMSERLSQPQFDELRQIVKRLNPQCIVWGTVRGQSPNHNSDTVIQGWMWSPVAQLNQAQSLFKHYQQSQKAKKAFLLNVAPDQTGRIPEDQLAVLMQVKKLMD